MNFSDWLIDETKKNIAVPVKTSKKKISSIAHTDIDRWLKSVDDLAKELNDLKNAKTRAKIKIDKIGKSKIDKPDENSSEKEKKIDQDSESELTPDAEDGTDVKVIDDKSNQKKLKKDDTE